MKALGNKNPGKADVLFALSKGGDIFSNKVSLVLKNSMELGLTALTVGFAAFFASHLVLNFLRYGFSSKPWILFIKYPWAWFSQIFGGAPDSFLDDMTPEDYLKTFGKLHSHWFSVIEYISIAVAVAAGLYGAYRLYCLFAKTAVEATQDKHLRGNQLLEVEELIENVKTVNPDKNWKGASPYTWVNGVPIGEGFAQYNIWVTGAVGAGKSQAMFMLMDQVAARRKQMIVFDVVCECASYYFREGLDVILNPFDKRFPGYSLFNEVFDRVDPDLIAQALMPIKNHNDNTEVYFKVGGQITVAELMRYLLREKRATQAELNKLIFNTQPAELHLILKGTPAEMYVDPNASGTGGGGFITSLRNALYVLRFVKDGPFSIKKFIWENPEGRMFITTPEAYATQLQPFTAMVFQIAINASLNQEKVEQTREDVRWFIADEFASMGPVPSMGDLATKGRKYGNVCMVGMQNIEQVEEVLPKHKAGTFRSVFQNQLIMQVTDSKTQKLYSEQLGEREIYEHSEGISYGTESSRDGGSDSFARKKIANVLPSELGMLSPLSGYLTLAGGYGMAKVAFKAKRRTPIAPGFLRDSALDLDAEEPKSEADLAAQAARLAAELTPSSEPTDGWVFEDDGADSSQAMDAALSWMTGSDTAGGEAANPKGLVDVSDYVVVDEGSEKEH